MKEIKEGAPIGETLPHDMKSYFRRIHVVLGAQQTALSLGGISGDRSRLGIVNELALRVIRLLVADDAFLYSYDEADTKPEYAKPYVSSDALAPGKRELVIKLRVLLEWAKEIVNIEEYISSFSPIAQRFDTVHMLLDPLVDQEEVARHWGEIKGNRERIARYVEYLQREVDNALHPSLYYEASGA